MTAPSFALILGIFYLAFGVLGTLPSLLMPPPADAPPLEVTALYGHFLGLFPVNIVHDAVHAAIGLWGLAAWMGVVSSVRFARTLTVAFGVMAVMGLIPGLQTFFGLMPVYGHDVWLNVLSAAAAGYIGFRSIARYEALRRKVKERRHSLAATRRASARKVALERRKRVYDRRYHGRLATG